MDIIIKEKNHISYNEENEFIDDSIHPNTAPINIQSTLCTPQQNRKLKKQIIQNQS